MSNLLWKSFNLCFSKFKCLPTITCAPPPTNEDDDQNPPPCAAALIKTFNSVYDSTTTSTTTDFFTSSDGSEADDLTPDFTTIFASKRFFFTSPGHSNSIIEPTDEPPLQPTATVVDGGIAVQTDSPDPYADFRRSMQEMIEAREIRDVEADWESLHELLLCYLTLNPKHTHKFIVGAFADLVVCLMMSPVENDACRKIDGN